MIPRRHCSLRGSRLRPSRRKALRSWFASKVGMGVLPLRCLLALGSIPILLTWSLLGRSSAPLDFAPRGLCPALMGASRLFRLGCYVPGNGRTGTLRPPLPLSLPLRAAQGRMRPQADITLVRSAVLAFPLGSGTPALPLIVSSADLDALAVERVDPSGVLLRLVLALVPPVGPLLGLLGGIISQGRVPGLMLRRPLPAGRQPQRGRGDELAGPEVAVPIGRRVAGSPRAGLRKAMLRGMPQRPTKPLELL